MTYKFLIPLSLVCLAACSDQQLREMAQVGTYNGQPMYGIDTEVILPASDERVAAIQDGIVGDRADRLCPGGAYREVSRGRLREIDRYEDYNPLWYGYYGSWDWGVDRYTVLQQEVRIICTAAPVPTQ